jgi:hypothetical protein
MWRRRGALTPLVLAAACVAAATSPAATPPPVTVIGDSVLTAVLWNEAPRGTLSKGLDVQWAVAVCRTLTGISCPFEGEVVPTVIDLVRAMGTALGPTVVVEAGYNDPPATFAQEVETVVQGLLAAGVQRILWVDLHEALPAFAAMNQALLDAALRHPQLTVLDWNGYARGHPSWFQNDGIHLFQPGANAIAGYLRANIIAALGAGLAVAAAPLPAARVGRPYRTRLSASGGLGPYRWSVTSGPLPRGLHLLADGELLGRPRRPARVGVTFRVVDSLGATAVHRATLVVEPAGAPEL